MKKYTFNSGKVKTDAYIHFEPVYLSDIGSMPETFRSNVSLSLVDYAKEIAQYEKEVHQSIRANYKNRFGFSLEFMLDKKRNDTFASQLIDLISDKIDEELPYWAYYYNKSSAWFIKLIFSNRYYYPEGLAVMNEAKQDKYRNSKTGRLCKADDPLAVKIANKGDVNSISIVHFSNKITKWKFASSRDFKKKIESLKAWYVEQIESLDKFSIDEGISLHRFPLSGLTNIQRQNAMVWNRTFKQAEDLINEQMWRLKYIDMYDEKANEHFGHLYNCLNQIIKNGKVSYGSKDRFIACISLNTRKHQTLKEYTDVFLEKVQSKLDEIILEIEK